MHFAERRQRRWAAHRIWGFRIAGLASLSATTTTPPAGARSSIRRQAEFTTPGNQGGQHRMDLLTVLEHEIGHLIG
jgi:hypothetical protein